MKHTPILIAISFGLVLATATAWTAERAAKAADTTPNVAGVWNVHVEFGGGSGNPVFTFEQDGEKLTGRYSGMFGEADVTGTIKGREVKFGFTTAGQGEQIRYVGTVDGDAMAGKVTLGSMGEGTFTGKRERTK